MMCWGFHKYLGVGVGGGRMIGELGSDRWRSPGIGTLLLLAITIFYFKMRSLNKLQLKQAYEKLTIKTIIRMRSSHHLLNFVFQVNGNNRFDNSSKTMQLTD